MSLLKTCMRKPLMGRIVQTGPPIPAHSIIVCRACYMPLYYTDEKIHGWGVPFGQRPNSMRFRDRLHPIITGMDRDNHSRLLRCPLCIAPIFKYEKLAISHVPFPGPLSMMEALHSAWRM